MIRLLASGARTPQLDAEEQHTKKRRPNSRASAWGILTSRTGNREKRNGTELARGRNQLNASFGMIIRLTGRRADPTRQPIAHTKRERASARIAMHSGRELVRGLKVAACVS